MSMTGGGLENSQLKSSAVKSNVLTTPGEADDDIVN